DLAVAPDATIAQAQQELRQLLGPGFQVDPPSGRGQQFEAMTAAYSMGVNISSLFALFIGMFLIYNSFAIAVTQRRSEIGILRALGATREQIRWLFLGESAVMGLVGSIVGAAFGVVIAGIIAGGISALLGDVYGVARQVTDIATRPLVLGSALAIGVITSLVAGLIPARSAARVDPVHALKKGSYQSISTSEGRVRTLLAVALAAVSLVCITFGRS